MRSVDLLGDGFERIRDVVRGVTSQASPDVLGFRPDAEANTVAWLIWHLSRVQDNHIAELVGEDEVWISEAWVDRFALPFDRDATGYGQDPDEVAAVRPDAELLAGYYDAVHERTMRYLSGLRDEDFDAVVDRAWDPPVTLAVRLISILSDDLQHAGQASYVRGLAERALG
ncbi:mycothiol transferase [Planctomonas psychrotolerans]|uniref:mycothiol transferase n=1 Tax=Planctomonas psychrotolerans TaxID=2528712 RepID=UPI0012399E78|nr:DinB family protein [Planctomonas psychrotolerans]